MRVENIGAQKSIPDGPQRPGLSEGDMLIAEVTDISGDRVILKNQNGGGVLTAKLLGDIDVAVGDYVETVVDEASGGRYVLRVVDISRQAPFATDTQVISDMRAQGEAARAQALLGALSMLKNNPGADPKAAAFLSRYGLAGSAENIEAVSAMAKNPLTALLTQIIKDFGSEEKTGQNTVTIEPGETAQAFAPASEAPNGTAVQIRPADGGNQSERRPVGQAEPSPSQMPPQDASAQSLNSGAVQERVMPEIRMAQNVGQALINDTVLTSEPSKEMQVMSRSGAGDTATADQVQRPPQMPPAAQDRDTVQPSGQNASQADLPQTGQETVLRPPVQAEQAPFSLAGKNGDASRPLSENAADAAGPYTETPDFGAKEQTVQNRGVLDAMSVQRGEMARRALDMFVRLDDADKLAAGIKKAVEKMPEQIKELKLLTEKSDSTVKETIGQKLDHIERQMSLMSEVKRFDCYQIPLQTAQRQTTAELYVYRYRGGKKTVDPDNILILLGLDTQYMGRVETLIKTSGKSLTVEFNLEDMRLADEVKADASELITACRQAGYTLSGVSVKRLAARTSVLNAEERLEKDTGGSAGNLDVLI